MISNIYEKSTANTLNGKRLNLYPLRSGIRQASPISSLQFSCSRVLISAQEQENKIKGLQIRKHEIKLFASVDDMLIIYVENPKESTKAKQLPQI